MRKLMAPLILLTAIIAVFAWVGQCRPQKEAPKENIYEKADSLSLQGDSVWLEWIEHERKAEADRRYLDSLLYLK